jgi:hypothetical protein
VRCEGADEVAVVQDAHGLGIRRDEQVERVAGVGDVVGVDRDAATAGEVAQLRVGQGRAQPRRRDDPQDVVDVHAGGVAGDDDDAVALGRGRQRRRLGDGRVGAEHERVSHRTGWSLTQRIAASISCSGMSCGSTPSPPRRARAAARRGPVTEFMLEATSGIVAEVPSPGDRSTSRRLVADRRGTRKTSE